MRNLFIILVLLAGWCQTHADEVEPLKVFVLAGQSNMVGKRSKAEELPAELQKEQTRAFVFSGGEWVPVRPGVTENIGFGPEISFCQRIAQRLGEPIGIIKLSIGGTSLAIDWSPDNQQSLYGKLRTLTEQANKTRRVQIVGMVWMQGGRDAKSANMAGAYSDNLSKFIKRARQDFKSPNMIFVCGRSAAPQSKYPHVGLVRKAQESITLSNYAWVDCDSIPLGKDGVHYSTLGQVQSGYQFADAMLQLINGDNE